MLATYITGLHHQGKSPATIAQVVAAVKWTASKSRIDVVGEITQRTLAGIRREGKDRGRGQVEGLIWQDVERIAAFAEADKTIAGLRDSAMIRLMSDCLLRVSEVVAVDVEDLNKTTLTVWQSKTDQEGHGESLYVCKSTWGVIKQYRQKAGVERGALFRQIRRGDHMQLDRLTDFSARRIIQKRMADRHGFQPSIDYEIIGYPTNMQEVGNAGPRAEPTTRLCELGGNAPRIAADTGHRRRRF